MRTSFHHQPEAQHPKSSAIHKLEGRLPHLLAQSGHASRVAQCPLSGVKRTLASDCLTIAVYEHTHQSSPNEACRIPAERPR